MLHKNVAVCHANCFVLYNLLGNVSKAVSVLLFLVCYSITDLQGAGPSLSKRVLGIHKKYDEVTRVNNKSYQALVERLSRKPRKNITKNDILSLHKSILGSVNPVHAGKYRTSNVVVRGRSIYARTPSPKRVPTLMNQFLSWLHTAKGDPIRIASDAHLKLVDIHPFRDANGRMARTLSAIVLAQAKRKIPHFRIKDRKKYIGLVHEALHRNNKKAYYSFLKKLVEEAEWDKTANRQETDKAKQKQE